MSVPTRPAAVAITPGAARSVPLSVPVAVGPLPGPGKATTGFADQPLNAPVVASAPPAVAAEMPTSVSEWIGQTVAALGAAFLPVASYQLAHVESLERPWLWGLVAAALAFSAPSVAAWAHTWTSKDPLAFPLKAWGFSVLLEGVMIASHTPWLSFCGLGMLVMTNAIAAWAAYGASRAARK